MRGRPAPEAAAAREGAAAESGCEWIGEEAEGVKLPSFPDFPTELDFSLPPLPRLLPRSLQLQRASAEQWRHGAAHSRAHASLDETAGGWTPVAAGASAGIAAGALLLLLGMGYSERRRRAGVSNLRTSHS